MARKLLVLPAIAIVVLSLCLAIPAFAAGMGNDVSGTITKIEGGAVTIKDSAGGEKTVEPTNPEALTGFKVGDHAAVKDGMLMKEGESEPSTPSPGSGY